MMNVFLLDAQDTYLSVPTDLSPDLIVDFGRAPLSTYQSWSSSLGCPVISLYDFGREIEDLHYMRHLLALGLGKLVDRYHIDWWDMVFLTLEPEFRRLVLICRLAREINASSRLTTSRPNSLAIALRLLLGCKLDVLEYGSLRRIWQRTRRLCTTASRLSPAQIRQVGFDKYDSAYSLRRRFALRPPQTQGSVVLLPTAYENTSRMEIAYARDLPEHVFLMVVARASGRMERLPDNVSQARLAAYASAPTAYAEEWKALAKEWGSLQRTLRAADEFNLAQKLSIMERGPAVLRWGLGIREAWNCVFQRHQVAACLSADDSNPYSRIPLALAKHFGLPSVAVHHGAMDYSMAFKQHVAETYMAKSEMERNYLVEVCRSREEDIVMNAPAIEQRPVSRRLVGAPWIVFFTEPYESDGWRMEHIYAEVLPPLCALAKRTGKELVLKLHPFENLKSRERLVSGMLSRDDRSIVKVIDSPSAVHIFAKTWLAVTVESTVAIDCVRAGVPVFLLGWLRHRLTGYARQFEKYGIGRILSSPAEISRIPEILRHIEAEANLGSGKASPVSSELLPWLLSGKRRSEGCPLAAH